MILASLLWCKCSMKTPFLLIIVLILLATIFFHSGKGGWLENQYLFEITILFIGIALSPIFTDIYKNRHSLHIMFNITKKGKFRKYIRVSFSYLFRITLKNSDGTTLFLLVENKRMKNSYQPVGGVYKYHDKGWLDKIGAKDAENFHKKNDLRLKIKGSKLPKLLSAFNSQEGREINHSREFYEELIDTKILDKKIFPWIDVKFIEKRNSGFRYSQHFECWEVNFYDILEINLNQEQENELNKLLEEQSDKFILATEELIRRGGNNGIEDICIIKEHTSHITNRK